MRLNLKTGPAAEPLNVEQAKNHLRVETSADDNLIASLITVARQRAEKETRRAFITQTWELILDRADAEIEIPKPPLQSVVSIKVIADDGSESAVNSTIYVVDASGDSPGRVKLKPGCSWPYHRGFASFIIEFKAGYGDGADAVPEPLKQATLQTIAHLYENRESSGIPEGAHALLFPYKVLYL